MKASAAELGVYEGLLATFTVADSHLEYGIIEHRYAETQPTAYRGLVEMYSHTV